MDLLHEEKEPIEWRSLHLGAERGANCEHRRALVTNIFQRHWEWQEDRRTDLQPGFYRYNTAFMASLDVKTAFDVAKPSVVSRLLTLTDVHGHLTAALLSEMQDVRGSSCLENSETEPNTCCGKQKETGKPKAGSYPSVDNTTKLLALL